MRITNFVKNSVSWPDAHRAMGKIVAATFVFAVWHSLLCSDGAKNFARRILGMRRGTGLYRAFFMAQSALTTSALVIFIFLSPHRVLYKARGARRFLGWGGQLAALGIFFLGFRELDKAKFLGIQGVRDLQKDEPLNEAQAQGPEIEPDGQIRATGIYRFSRHPLEWAPVLLLMTSPVMKTNWLAFNFCAAIYSLLGALHEEKRLLRQSPNYAKYQQQVAFFWGRSRAK